MPVNLADGRARRLISPGVVLLLGLFVWPQAVPGADDAAARALRALPENQLPRDRRLGTLKDLDGYFPFQPPATPEAWAERAKVLRRELAVAVGLWPMPPKSPLNPVIHGRIEQSDYTVEKVYFESLPGFFVTGNLYRPKGRTGKLPAVLCPHGHWPDGRFVDSGPEEIRRQIVRGEERFENGGRSVLQARCAQLARMGCVVFHYDMIGYADSVQIPNSIAHGFSRQRPEMNTAENWGLFTPQAEAHLQSVMGLQTWNSIRSLDFLLDLPEVDPARIGVTGASGGGTQTFILCALDDRPAVAFPAVMVGTAMQGGCTCENACLLRVDTGNVEIAGLFAPKPLGMTAADDWTREMATKGMPELQKLFAMLGAPKNVHLAPLVQFKHNYNYVSRAVMYSWMNAHLKLGLAEPVVEEDYPRLPREQLTVWDEQHPKPAGGPEFERSLLRQITQRDQQALAGALDSMESFRAVYGGAFDAILGRNLAMSEKVEWTQSREAGFPDHKQRVGVVRNDARGEELPVVVLEPSAAGRHVVLWADANGKGGLFDRAADGSLEPKPAVKRLVKSGVTVIGVDLLYQGEFLADAKPLERARKVSNPREAAAFTFGYNYSLFAQRVHDLLTVIRFAKGHWTNLERLDVVGLNGAGPWVAAARAQAPGAIAFAAIDTGGFRFAKVPDIYDLNFLPGGAKYGDLPGLLALGAPGKLWLTGESAEAPDLVKRVYQLANAGKSLTLAPARSGGVEAVKWLLSQSR